MWAVPSGAFMNVFNGHSGPVTSGMFTPDGKKIVTVSEDASLIVWDPKTAVAVHRITSDDARFHSDVITSLAINKDSSLAMTGSADGTAKLVNIHSGSVSACFIYLYMLFFLLRLLFTKRLYCKRQTIISNLSNTRLVLFLFYLQKT
jgi:WD40 repeat protein